MIGRESNILSARNRSHLLCITSLPGLSLKSLKLRHAAVSETDWTRDVDIELL